MKIRLPKWLARGTLAHNIVSALALAFIGFVLLNFAFLFDYLFQSGLSLLLRQLIGQNFEMASFGFPVMHILYWGVIALFSYFVLKSKLGVFLKASFLVVPVAVTLVTIGIFLYTCPVLAFSLGAIVWGGITYYLYRSKKHWLYFYSVTLITVVLAVFTLSGGEM